MWNADLTRKLNSWSVSKVQYNRAWSLYKWSSMLLNPCLQILLDSIQWDIIHSPTEVIIQCQFVWRMFLDKFVIFARWLVEAFIYWTEYSCLGSLHTAQRNPVKSMRIECHDVKLETNLITLGSWNSLAKCISGETTHVWSWLVRLPYTLQLLTWFYLYVYLV